MCNLAPVRRASAERTGVGRQIFFELNNPAAISAIMRAEADKRI